MRLPRIPGAAALQRATTGPVGVIVVQLAIAAGGRFLLKHAGALAALHAGAEVHPAGALEHAYESGRQDGAAVAVDTAREEGYQSGLRVGFTAAPADPEPAPEPAPAPDLYARADEPAGVTVTEGNDPA